jgi:single-strand DNA-binding protein
MRDLNSLNRVFLIGRLGGKPERRVLPQSGRPITRFTLATNERFFNKTTRDTTDRTEWHKIVVWGNQADFAEKYLTQGQQVCIEGKLRTRSWQDKDGNKRSTTEIEAETIVLLGRREGVPAEGQAADLTPAADFPMGEEEGPGKAAAERTTTSPFKVRTAFPRRIPRLSNAEVPS